MESKMRTVFHDKDLLHDSFEKFENMRRKGEFCDITLNFESESILAHKVVLSARIPYFSEILGSSDSAGNRKIAIDDIGSYALKSLLDYAYTCRIEMTTENAESLLRGACALRMSGVRDACCNFLAEDLTSENVLHLRQLAYDLKCSDLVENCDSHICENFEEVSGKDEFLKLPFTVVKSLIARDDLKVSSEDEVLRVVLNWIKAWPTERQNLLTDLLSDIRVIYLTPKYLSSIAASEGEIGKSICSYATGLKNSHSLSVKEKLALYPQIRPRAIRATDAEYRQAMCLFFLLLFLCLLVTPFSSLWCIGFVVMALDKHCRILTKYSTATLDETLVKYVIRLYMIVLFVHSPIGCLLFVLSKCVADFLFQEKKVFLK